MVGHAINILKMTSLVVILRHFIWNMNSVYLTMKATTKTDLFKTMNFNKCSGMDGFPNEHYNVFWIGISLFVTPALYYIYAFDCSGDLKNKVEQFIASLMS